MLDHLEKKAMEYLGRDYALAYVLHILRSEITQWLYEHKLDQDTYTQDECTLLAVQALCNANTRIG